MAGLIYGLCALTALLCTCLLLRGYDRSKYPLLLWGGLCFAGQTLSNIILVVDQSLPQEDLSIPRQLLTLSSLMVLLCGLIWDTE